MVVTTQHSDHTTITLSPNRSATWQQTKWVIAVMVAVVMIIAVAWSFVGAWVVLPFAGLEVGLFAFIMYKVSVFTHSQQIIDINNTKIHISSGYKKHQKHLELVRDNIDVYYSVSDNHWELPRIAFCSSEQKVTVGDFLNLEDRVKLKEQLQDAGFIVCNNKWWQS